MTEKHNDKSSNGTPFDDVFRTLLEKCTKLIIPVINEIFGTNYDMNENITLLSNEHYYVTEDGEAKKRITDSCILIRKKLYHLECEIDMKSDMSIRMIEYDFHIALSHMEEERLTLRFPESAVLQLRHHKNSPKHLQMRLILPGKQEVVYRIPVIRVQNYDKEELFDKELLFFIPYYILKFEKKLAEIDREAKKVRSLAEDYEDIYRRLQKLEENQRIDSNYLHNLVELTRRLITVVAGKSNNVAREVNVMGGQVLELESERIEARALAQGRTQGRAEGARENILGILEDLGEIPDTLLAQIENESDLETLKRWVKYAAKADTMEEFTRRIEEDVLVF